MKTKTWIYLICVAFILGCLFVWFGKSSEIQLVNKVVTEKDSNIVVPHPPLVINNAKPSKIKYYKIAETTYVYQFDTIHKHDTIFYLTPAYCAELDTILKNDTIGIQFNHPQRIFKLVRFQSPPDTIKQQTITIDNSFIIKENYLTRLLKNYDATLTGLVIGSVVTMYLKK